MENEEVIKIFTAYYSDVENQEKMLPYLKDREVAVCTKEKSDYPFMRYIKIDKIEYIPFKINFYMRMNKVPYNLYSSLNMFRNGMLACKTREDKDRFCDTFHKFLQGSDLGFDFDCDSPESIQFPQKDALYVCKTLEKLEMHPEIIFSGMGFQVVVRYEHLLPEWRRLSFNPFENGNFFDVSSDWLRSFKKKCPTLDLKTIEPRRVFKVPYSLVYNRKKADEIFMCQPLTKDQLIHFKIQEMLYHAC